MMVAGGYNLNLYFLIKFQKGLIKIIIFVSKTEQTYIMASKDAEMVVDGDNNPI